MLDTLDNKYILSALVGAAVTLAVTAHRVSVNADDIMAAQSLMSELRNELQGLRREDIHLRSYIEKVEEASRRAEQNLQGHDHAK